MDFYIIAYEWGILPGDLMMRASGLELVLMKAALKRIYEMKNGKPKETEEVN